MHDLAKKKKPPQNTHIWGQGWKTAATILKFEKEKINTVGNKQITENIQTNK